MSDYFEFTHNLSSIQKWFGKIALIRTLGSAGLIPITNKGIVYDITEQSGVLEWAQDIGGPFQQRQTLHLDDSSFEFEKSVFTFGNGEPKLSLHRQEKKAISYTFKGSFDEFVGSDRADIIYGNNDWNIVKGQGGDDYIEGRGGNDSLWGGTGFNLLKGGQGIDSVNFQLSEGAHQELGAPDRLGNYEFNGFRVVTTQEGLEDHGNDPMARHALPLGGKGPQWRGPFQLRVTAERNKKPRQVTGRRFISNLRTKDVVVNSLNAIEMASGPQRQIATLLVHSIDDL